MGDSSGKQSELWRCYSAGFGGGGRGHEPRHAGGLLKLDSFLESPKGTQPHWPLDFAQGKPFQISDLQDMKDRKFVISH